MWLLLVGCQEPFGANRHDLVGFRLAAVEAGVVPDGTRFVPRVAVIVDGRAWSDAPVLLEWAMLPDEDAALSPFEAEATGPRPSLVARADARTMAVRATSGGDERTAFLTLAAPPATQEGLAGFDIGRIDPRPSGPGLSREAREALVPTPGSTVEPGGWLRLRAVPRGDADPLVRFMGTAGTFLELDRATTDWGAVDGLRLDEDTLDDPGKVLRPGPVTLVALALGQDGETAFAATEVFVGSPPDGLWVRGRFVPTDGAPTVPDGQGLRATLRADPEAPSGVRLEGGSVVDPASVRDWGTSAMGCVAAVDGPLDPSWFLDQSCTVDAVDGAEVVVVPDVLP